jgi:hypothetical protein
VYGNLDRAGTRQTFVPVATGQPKKPRPGEKSMSAGAFAELRLRYKQRALNRDKRECDVALVTLLIAAESATLMHKINCEF